MAEASEKEPKKGVDIVEHQLSIQEVCAKFGTQVDVSKPGVSPGLSPEKAAGLLLEYGPNMLSPPKRLHPILKYLKALANVFNLLLLFAGIVGYILYGVDPINNQANTYLGGILIGVAFINATIEHVQAAKSEALMNSFMDLIPKQTSVVRNGNLQTIDASELVVGDVVFIRMGEKVPADVRIFFASDLKVDNSSLTGEGEPQERTDLNTQKNPLEATNLLFYGSLVVSGECYAVVIRTGDNTVLGQIAGLTANEKKRESPMQQEITVFVYKMAVIAGLFAILFIAVMAAKGATASAVVNNVIGIFVAFVPQGLPTTVTMLLSIAAKRLAGKNILVKDLQGVETLGSITLLATDKTGTLTKNQMAVTNIWTNDTVIAALDNRHVEGVFIDTNISGVNELITMMYQCSRARFDKTDVPVVERNVLGDATETGLLQYAAQKVPDIDDAYLERPKIFEIPFNSDNKWTLSIHRWRHSAGHFILYMKGAPERILRLCSHILIDNKPVPLNEDYQKKFLAAYELFAGKGHRVLAFAQLLLPEDPYASDYQFTKNPKNYPSDGLCFVGLVSLEDPPKHGVREAVGHCREAGIRVIMVTGDHPLTAEAIGRKINIMIQDTKEKLAAKTNRPVESITEGEYNAIVIHGEQIDHLSDGDWDRIFSKDEIIFARTSPKHKLQIVKRSQARGHIVGVTGDGVNDSPALKTSDLGISMNFSGSDVSKEAAAMILLDDNFANIITGIEQGRLIFVNLKKSIRYTLTHIMPEVTAFLINALIGLPLGLTAIQILLVDLGFELALSVAFAWEPPETKSGLMKYPPRKPVTEKTAAKLARHELMRTETSLKRMDPDNFHERSGWESFKWSFTTFFTRTYWTDKFAATDEEVLVDNELLIWSYLESGILVSLICLISYFVAFFDASGYLLTPFLLFDLFVSPTPVEVTRLSTAPNNYSFTIQANQEFANRVLSVQPPSYTNFPEFYASYANGTLTVPADFVTVRIQEAQAIYYITIMLMQIFNCYCCKARVRLPFGLVLLRNQATFIGIGIGAAFAMAMAYIPYLNNALQMQGPNPLYWLIGIGGGCFLLLYTTIRTLILRKVTDRYDFHRIPQGLDLHPTVVPAESARATEAKIAALRGASKKKETGKKGRQASDETELTDVSHKDGSSAPAEKAEEKKGERDLEAQL